MSMPDVGVVGAGLAGLAAAWHLVRGGAKVTVYERGSIPGGRLRSETTNGYVVDSGVQLLASHFTETLALAEAASASRLLAASPGRDALWRDGRAHPLVYGSIASMASSRALPVGLKLRLASRYVPFLRKHANVLDTNEPAAARSLDGESIAVWGRRELGEDFVELLAYPLLAAYNGAMPEETSAGYYHALAWAGMSVQLLGVRGGAGALPAAIATALEERGVRIRYSAEVREVSTVPEGMRVRTTEDAAVHGAAVLAVPAAEALAIADLGEAAGWLAAVRSRPVISLALFLDEPTGADYFGLSIPRSVPPGESLAAITVQENKIQGLTPPGTGLLVVFPSPARAAKLEGSTPRAVLDALLPGVERVFPGTRRRVVRAKTYRFPAGYTLLPPGSLARLRDLDYRTLPDRMALAGDYLVAPTVEGAVRSGIAAARRILG